MTLNYNKFDLLIPTSYLVHSFRHVKKYMFS